MSHQVGGGGVDVTGGEAAGEGEGRGVHLEQRAAQPEEHLIAQRVSQQGPVADELKFTI